MAYESDAFPSRLSSDLRGIVVPRIDYKYAEKPFIPRLEEGGVIFKYIQVEKPDNNFNHFKYVWSKANSFSSIDETPWDKISKRLERPPFSPEKTTQKNSDVALAYQIKHNTFLTKKFFTFGLRATHEGVGHIYQTHNKPLLFYLPKYPPSDHERTFTWHDQRHYNCFVLEEYSQYLVDENTTYLIMTMEPTLFAVDAILLSKVKRYKFKSPTETTIHLYRKRRKDTSGEEEASRRMRRETEGRETCHENDGSAYRSTDETSERSQTAGSLSGYPPEGDTSRFSTMNFRRGLFTHQNLDLNRSVTVNEPVIQMSELEEQPFLDAESEGQPPTNNDPEDQSDGSQQHPTRSVLSRVADGVAGPSSATHSTPLKNTYNFGLPSHSRYCRTSTPRKPSNSQNQPFSPEDTARSLNCSSLTEPYSALADEPTEYEETDEFGNIYRYTPIDLNWSENERRPISVRPIRKNYSGKYFLYVPIKQ